MARLLHILKRDAWRWCRAFALSFLVAVLTVTTGCLIPPELPVDPDEPSPPYFGNVSPPERFKTITAANTSIAFDITVFDKNRHPRMYYALVNDQRGTDPQGSVASSGFDDIENATEYELSSDTIAGLRIEDLCDGAPESGIETFTLYVADREFVNVSASNSEPPALLELDGLPPGFLISRSWVLEYGTDACE